MFAKKLLIGFSLFSVVSAMAAEYQGYTILEAAPDSKSLPTVLVPPYKLYPIQLTLGQAMVREIIKDRFGVKIFSDLKYKWDDNKDLEANLRSLKSNELQVYVEEMQTRMNKASYGGGFTPTGVFLFGGYHRCRAAYEVNQTLAKLSSNPKIRIFVPIKLEINYSSAGLTENDIAKDIFITRAQGFVTDREAGIKAGMNLQDAAVLKFQYLTKKAPHLGALVDNPYRSLIGGAMYDNEIQTETFVPHVEYYLEDLFKDKIDKAVGGKGVYPGMTIGNDLINRVKKVIFSDKATLEKVGYWARFGNLSKEQAYERCLMLEKKDDKTQTAQENSDEKICKSNREKLLKHLIK